MMGKDPYLENDELRKVSVLKRIFDTYAGETITDEQLQRILDPVIAMIQEGRL